MNDNEFLKVTTPTDREVLLTRVFDAPRQLVFDALTKPEMLRKWFGPHGWYLADCDVNLRSGGGFRFTLRAPDGNEVEIRGVYREVVSPERSVHVESFGNNRSAWLVTTILTEQYDRTTCTVKILYPSKEFRDAVIGAGAEQGAAESYDKLAEALQRVRAVNAGDFI